MSVRFVNKIEEADIVTHGGNSFHSDDIFGIVFLELLYNDVRCYRVPFNELLDDKKLADKIVFDVGGGSFDHHQSGGNGYHKKYNNKKEAIPYASFGLLWDHYGDEFIEKYYNHENDEIFKRYIKEYVDFNLVKGIDAADNAIFPHSQENLPPYRLLSISCVISFLNSSDELDDNENNGLRIALKLAKKCFTICLDKAQNAYLCHAPYNRRRKRVPRKDFERVIRQKLLTELAKVDMEVVNRKKINLDKTLNPEFISNSIYEYWISNADEYCKRISSYGVACVKRHISSTIYGFCAESLGIRGSFDSIYDDMSCMMLGDVFSSQKEYGEAFEDDLKEIFDEVFKNTVKTALFKRDSKNYVQNKVLNTDGHILVLNEHSYWQDWLANMPEGKQIWFVVCPTENGNWKVKPVPCKYNQNGYRKGFPSKWFGYTKGALKEGYEDLADKDVMFIHSSGFLAICSTLNSAVDLAEKSFDNEENKPIEKLQYER